MPMLQMHIRSLGNAGYFKGGDHCLKSEIFFFFYIFLKTYVSRMCSLQILWRNSQNWRIYGVFRGAVSNARMSHAELWTRFPQNYIFQPRWQSTEKTIRPIDMSNDIYCSENPLLLRADQLFLTTFPQFCTPKTWLFFNGPPFCYFLQFWHFLIVT